MREEYKIHIYERYSEGNLSEEATRLLLGEDFDLLQEDIEAFHAAAADDTSTYLKR
jgi:hypothetical protein